MILNTSIAFIYVAQWKDTSQCRALHGGHVRGDRLWAHSHPPGRIGESLYLAHKAPTVQAEEICVHETTFRLSIAFPFPFLMYFSFCNLVTPQFVSLLNMFNHRCFNLF